MKIVWSAAAARQPSGIVDHIEADSARGAAMVRRRILGTVVRLGQMAHSGREGRMAGTREAYLPHTLHIVVYQVSDLAVEIVAIQHATQDWPTAF